MTGRGLETVAVWDPLVRIGHWALVAGFVTAYLTEGEPLGLHIWAGYAIGMVVLFRVYWGFVGPTHARFASFASGPGAVLGYLRDLLSFRSRRHVGHSPAGGAMTIALLLCLAVTVSAGMLAYGDEKHAGPLAFMFPAAAPGAEAPLFPTLDGAPTAARSDTAGSSRDAESVFVEIHELFANLTLGLVVLHIGGVVLASAVHRENLARAMLTGRKRAP